MFAAQQGLHRDRHRHAGARHRRQRGDLQPDRRADAPLAAGRPSATAAAAVARSPTGRQGGLSQRLVSTRPALDDQQRDIFSGVAGYSSAVSPSRVGSRHVDVVAFRAPVVTGRFYDTLGLQPAAGRLLTARRRRSRAPRLVAVASYGYWERAFARDPRHRRPHHRASTACPPTIVGVSPRGFVGANVGAIADLTLPVAALPSRHPAGRRSARARQLLAARAGAAAAGSGAGRGAGEAGGGVAARSPSRRSIRTGRPRARRRSPRRSRGSRRAAPDGPTCATSTSSRCRS